MRYSDLSPAFSSRSTRTIRRILMFTLLILFASTLGCASGSSGGDDGGDGDDGGTNPPPGDVDSSFLIPIRTNSSGLAQAEFRLAQGSVKFAITAFTPSSNNQVRFLDLSSSNGTNYLDPRGEEISFANFFASGVNSINAPSRDVDPDLRADDTYNVVVEVVSSGGNALPDSEINLLVTSRQGGSFSGGTVVINLFFVGEIGADNTTRTVVARAVEEFRSIYSSQMGINLDIRTIDIDGPLLLPSPFEGSAFYESATNSTGGLAINIFIGGDIAGGAGGILGIAGGIIAPPVPSRRSALAIGIIPGAGPDGVYDDEDIRILGETLAHESGHYLGLFHPVDFSGNTAVATDPLDDTDTCASFTACLANDSLTHNLMFTTPVSDGDGGFVRQNQLTSQQSGVGNRYTAVD